MVKVMKCVRSGLAPTGSSAIVLCVVAALMTGCGKQKEASGQVVAKVNGTEISIYQLNSALSRTPGVTPQNVEEFRPKVLDKLIDQQLAIAKSQEKELDRTPEVVQAMEEAKRDILSRAYLDKIAATVPKTTEEEARTYYKAHPELFADRHVYQFQELATPVGRAPVDAIRDMLKMQSTEEVEKWLKDKKVEYYLTTGVRAAEQMPPPALREIRNLKNGEVTVVQTGGTVSIIKLLASQTAPVSEAVALPEIRRLLDTQNDVKAMTSELKLLRDKAKIEITGIEGKTATDQKSAGQPVGAAATAPVQASAPAPVVKAAPLPVPVPAPAPPAVNIEKGVAGLK
jgi:EpsD family peptidyl-prolyl cis-trans isomerase